MQIPKTLLKLGNDKILFIATGKQVANIYLASGEEIDLIKTIKIDAPKYSDKEGFSARTKGGKFYCSGSALKDLDDIVKVKFLEELGKLLRGIIVGKKFKSIYVFTPDYMTNGVKDVFPRIAGNTKIFFIKGNFTKYSPIDLLEKIKKS